MTKINPKCLRACQLRLNEKEQIYSGDRNYKNMVINDLQYWWDNDFQIADVAILGRDKEVACKKLVDLINRSWMLWERLSEEKLINKNKIIEIENKNK